MSQANATLLEDAWDVSSAHLKFVSSNVAGETVRVESIAESIKRWTAEPDPGSKGKILSVDIVGDRLAVVKFELMWKAKTYLDYLSLYKVNDEWKLVNKLFVAR